MLSPITVRLDESVVRRLTSYVARHHGATRSSVAGRYVDEGLRMDEHPGIVFRDGAAGRRATLIGGPDVWEVVRAVAAARAAEPALATPELLASLEESTGVPVHLLTVALEYWACYPSEVDAFVAHAAEIETAQAASTERSRALLSG
jgi:hypothetical protein